MTADRTRDPDVLLKGDQLRIDPIDPAEVPPANEHEDGRRVQAGWQRRERWIWRRAGHPRPVRVQRLPKTGPAN